MKLSVDTFVDKKGQERTCFVLDNVRIKPQFDSDYDKLLALALKSKKEKD